MAREIRIQRKAAGPEAAPVMREPQAPVMREPRTTEEALQAAEASRGRISATLDEIEDRIDETREQIRERADVLRPVRSRIRENPLPVIGAAMGAGLVLGLLTGGEEEGREGRRHGMLDEEERKELREWRAQRRERLIDRLGRERRSAATREEGPSMFGQLAAALASAAAAGLMARVRDRVTGAAEEEPVIRREEERGFETRHGAGGMMGQPTEGGLTTRRGAGESY